MDSDISHAVEARLVAIEARLDALDGGPDQYVSEEEVEPTDEEPTPVTTSRRGRKQKDTVEESVVDTTTPEWSS